MTMIAALLTTPLVVSALLAGGGGAPPSSSSSLFPPSSTGRIRRRAVPPTPSSFSSSLPASATNDVDDNDDESDESSRVHDCLVVGGGISGSTLAYNLHASDVDVVLCESRDYLGGNVRSVVRAIDDGQRRFVYELGPNSFATQPSIIRISHDLNIQDELVFADVSLPPWVNYNNKLHPLPKGNGKSKGSPVAGQLELLFGSNGIAKFALVGDLLSWHGKIRAGMGAFIGHAPPPPSSTSSSSTGGGGGGEKVEETIKEWVIRILGDEVFYRIIDPFVSGVYAGDPTTLSMSSALPKICNIESMSYDISWNKFGGALFYGGLARQIELTKERRAYPPDASWVDFEYGNPGSYRMGLSTLPLAIQDKLGNRVRLGWKLIDIVKKNTSGDDGDGDDGDDGGCYYMATFETSTGNRRMINARSVVSTVPAHAIGYTLNNVLPGSANLFTKYRDGIQRNGIYYPPVAAVTLAYPKTSFRDVELSNGFGKLCNLPGFGLLNPRSEGIRTLGSLWSSSLFPNRCPPEYNILLNYIGGSRDPEIGTMSNEDIVSAVDVDLRKTLLDPSNAVPPIVLGVKLWPSAIPQYELGHATIINELQDLENNNLDGGIWVCGNYRTGVAFPDCVTFGYEHAKIVADYLKTKKKKSGTTATTKH